MVLAKASGDLSGGVYKDIEQQVDTYQQLCKRIHPDDKVGDNKGYYGHGEGEEEYVADDVFLLFLVIPFVYQKPEGCCLYL